MDQDRKALAATSQALVAEFQSFRTWQEWRRSPALGALEARLLRHLDRVRRCTPARPGPPISRAGGIHVVHWNILHGANFEAVRRALREEPDLAGADLISLNEVDLGLARSGNRDVGCELAQELGLEAAWTPLFLELAGGYRTPRAVAAALQAESFFGLALLSRWPLGAVRRVVLASPSQLLFDRERKLGTFVALIAEVQRPGAPFHCVVTHLDVHASPSVRAEQMRCILAALPAGPAVLAGDLNTTTFPRGGNLRGLRTLAFMALVPRRRLDRRLLAPHLPAGKAREPLFDVLRRAGFEIEPYNDGGATLAVHFEEVGELDFLPGVLRRFALRFLRHVERRNRLRLDWIVARGFAADPARPPRALSALLFGEPPASDHAPISIGLRDRSA